MGEYLSDWAEMRGYSPVVELAKLTEADETRLAKAGAVLWETTQAEAAAVLERDRIRMAETIAQERALRNEACGMVDARDAVIEALRSEIARHESEVEELRRHVGVVRAREFWQRVAQEIWDVLPEREPMHVNDISRRVGLDIVKEAEEHPGEWGPELLRGVIDQRVKFRKLFANEGGGRYRRRRPEDDAA
ncbi:hypothetical protein ACFQE0_17420 [Methylobacterium komagatae]|uniref:Uncharacterized protein n=1 Tax=Methylobacterium komagatae TaxID=374425 RepID=A0ABW2BN24_9HYPH